MSLLFKQLHSVRCVLQKAILCCLCARKISACAQQIAGVWLCVLSKNPPQEFLLLFPFLRLHVVLVGFFCHQHCRVLLTLQNWRSLTRSAETDAKGNFEFAQMCWRKMVKVCVFCVVFICVFTKVTSSSSSSKYAEYKHAGQRNQTENPKENLFKSEEVGLRSLHAFVLDFSGLALKLLKCSVVTSFQPEEPRYAQLRIGDYLNPLKTNYPREVTKVLLLAVEALKSNSESAHASASFSLKATNCCLQLGVAKPECMRGLFIYLLPRLLLMFFDWYLAFMQMIFVKNGGPNGDWQRPHFCPKGTFAAGYEIKVTVSPWYSPGTGLYSLCFVCVTHGLYCPRGKVLLQCVGLLWLVI